MTESLSFGHVVNGNIPFSVVFMNWLVSRFFRHGKKGIIIVFSSALNLRFCIWRMSSEYIKRKYPIVMSGID